MGQVFSNQFFGSKLERRSFFVKILVTKSKLHILNFIGQSQFFIINNVCQNVSLV